MTLSPSQAAVLECIKRHELVTMPTMMVETKLGDRTIRSALGRLRELKLIERRHTLRDGRLVYYRAVSL